MLEKINSEVLKDRHLATKVNFFKCPGFTWLLQVDIYSQSGIIHQLQDLWQEHSQQLPNSVKTYLQSRNLWTISHLSFSNLTKNNHGNVFSVTYYIHSDFNNSIYGPRDFFFFFAHKSYENYVKELKIKAKPKIS